MDRYMVEKTKLILLLKDKLYAYIGLTFAVSFWAANTVLARGVVKEINPMALSFWRWFVALILILPFGLMHIKKEMHEIRNNKIRLSILSFFSVTVYNSVLYEAAHFTTATNMSIATATLPAITIVMAWLVINDIPSRLQIAGIIISALGMVIIVFRGSFENIYRLEFSYGDLMVIGSMTSWSLYSVFLRKFDLKIHPMSLLTITIGLGVLFILPFYCWEIIVMKKVSLGRHAIFVFLFTGIFPSILAYLFWNNAVAKVGPSTSAMFLYLLPVFSAYLSATFLGEVIGSFHILGGILIFIGLFLAVQRGHCGYPCKDSLASKKSHPVTRK
jgi:drug/metabolite transporter (DMT)-like permease